MSEENVEIVRRSYEAFGRGDREGMVAAMDRDIEWRARQDLPDAATYRGPEAVLDWFATWLAAWRDFKLETREFIDAGDYVVVVTQQSGIGTESGAFAEFAETHLWKISGGKATEVVEYRTKSDALEAAGLSE